MSDITTENYIYKKEVDWSVLTEGLTFPIDLAVVFSRTVDRFLQKGEKKAVKIIVNRQTFYAVICNVNFDKKYERHADVVQLRYPKNGDLAQALQHSFISSYLYIKMKREQREEGDRSQIRLPEGEKEYLAIYTTEYDDTYIFEPITVDDLYETKQFFAGMNEVQAESELNFSESDPTASVRTVIKANKVRKLNRKIGENLKQLYDYRCQICGKLIGEKYGSHVAEAHHIDYFINSLNNDADNQLIVCPNHHRIIHNANPKFNRKTLEYVYPNGFTEGLRLNKHIHI